MMSEWPGILHLSPADPGWANTKGVCRDREGGKRTEMERGKGQKSYTEGQVARKMAGDNRRAGKV